MNNFTFTLSELRISKVAKCLKEHGEVHLANIIKLQVMEQKALTHLESIRVRLLQAEAEVGGQVNGERQGAEAAH